MILAPLGVVGLWPGLNFEWFVQEGRTPVGVGIGRLSDRQTSLLRVGIGVASFTWERRANANYEFEMPSILRRSNFGLAAAEGEMNCLILHWR
jgi:hypothetical protein